MHHHTVLNPGHQQQNGHIPEPAIWHIFSSLIKAGLVMERTDAGSFKDIVHLDIKPENVFLGDYPRYDPQLVSNNFDMYPIFKLGELRISDLPPHRRTSARRERSLAR